MNDLLTSFEIEDSVTEGSQLCSCESESALWTQSGATDQCKMQRTEQNELIESVCS